MTERLLPFRGTEEPPDPPWVAELFEATSEGEIAAILSRLEAEASVVTAAVAPLEFGDVEGHPFHGNQYTGGYNGEGAGTKEDPVRCQSAEEAAKLIADGKYVSMPPEKVSILLDKLAELAQEAKAKGEKAPAYDLCHISVPDSNLFCAESLGIPRIQMPQVGDGSGFKAALTKDGYTFKDTDVTATFLKPTQSELNGGKVAGIMKSIEAGSLPPGRIFVSSDNYVIDGHHRWAAVVGEDYDDAKGGSLKIDVTKIDAPISVLIPYANKFAETSGEGHAALAVMAPLEFYSEDEERDAHGRWSSGGGDSGGPPAPIRWHSVSAAHGEGSEYEGEYRGTKVRVERNTDFQDEGRYGKSNTTTVWHGFVEDKTPSGKQFWSLVAESYATRKAATTELTRWLDRKSLTASSGISVLSRFERAELYADDQPRDAHGQWTTGDGLPRFKDSVDAPVKFLADGKLGYIKLTGMSTPGSKDFSKVMSDPHFGGQVADHYSQLPMYDKNAEPAYNQLAKEVDAQYAYLTQTLGVKVDVTDHDPYENIKQLRDDIEQNHHLGVLSTEVTGAHPYLTNDQNDRFRAVHDAFGHAAIGRGFDRNGEEAAFQSHAQMFSSEATRALASETRGQNNAMIYGKYPEGTFPPQKFALLPVEDSLVKAPRSVVTAGGVAAPTADDDNLNDVTNVHHASLGRRLRPRSASVELGDAEGHPFHGNQWTGGKGGQEDKAVTANENRITVVNAFKIDQADSGRGAARTKYETATAVGARLQDDPAIKTVLSGKELSALNVLTNDSLEGARTAIVQVADARQSTDSLRAMSDRGAIDDAKPESILTINDFAHGVGVDAPGAKETAADVRDALRNSSGAPPTPDQIAAIISEAAVKNGLTIDPIREFVSDRLSLWALTSGDSDSRAISMQIAAADVYRTPDSVAAMEHYVKESSSVGEITLSGAKADDKLVGDVNRSVVGAMRDETNSWLKQQGIDPSSSITLYRGINEQANTLLGTSRPADGVRMTSVKLNPLSSWSPNPRTAAGFASSTRSVVLKMDVPVSRLVSTPFSGFGSLAENEVVISGDGENRVQIIDKLDAKNL